MANISIAPYKAPLSKIREYLKIEVSFSDKDALPTEFMNSLDSRVA